MDDTTPNLSQLGRDLRAVFPELDLITPCRVLGVGFRSIAVETDEGTVFRIARNQAGAQGHASASP